MNKFRWLTNLVVMLLAISANAQDFPSALDVSRPWCFNVDIVAPEETPGDPGHAYHGTPGYIMPNPQLYPLDNGDLLMKVNYLNYVTDAVTKGSKVVWFVSANGGIDWRVLKNKPADFAAFSTLNGALKLPDGTLLAISFPGWENFPESEREKLTAQGYYLFGEAGGNAPGIVSICRRVVMSRSRDGGKSWETKDIKLPFMAEIALDARGVVLRDGTYVHPAYGLFKKEKIEQWPPSSSLALRTKDNGEHWEMSTIAKGDFDFNETSITQAANGDLVAVMRTTAQKEVWTATSSDDGKSWSAPRDSGMRGSTPWVVTTKQGLLVAVYARRETKQFPTTGIFACVSRDNGQSWDVEHQAMIRDNGSAFVDGSPQAVALPDGSVFAVYGLILSIPGRTASGGISASNRLAVGGTRFSPAYQGIPVLSFEQAPAEPK